MTTATLNPPLTTFTKLSSNDFIRSLIKEARRVKYTVKKDSLTVKVTDPDNKDALVFKAVRANRHVWATTFATAYWQDGSVPVVNA